MALFVDIRNRMGRFQLDVRFQAEQETLALLGASGCGKSVTLRCIAGILSPDEGKIVLDGVTLFDSAAQIDLPPQRRQVGYLFQQYALFPNMTTRQNIAVAVRDRRQREAIVAEALRRFQLEGVADQRPWQLSGGQQQRCALARILAAEPKAILLDEPFSALDSYLKSQLEIELAETLERFSGTILWVSHDRDEVFRNCRRVCVIDRGCSQPVTTPEELLHAPGTEAAARLSGCQNYADAMPRETDVSLPAWGLTLSCGRRVPAGIRRVGIRACHVRPAVPGDTNCFSCRVVRVVTDASSITILLRPEDAPQDAPLLRMELGKDAWQALPGHTQLTVAIQPQDILLLET